MFAADRVMRTTQQSARTGSINKFVWHHQAGTNDDATIGMMVSGSKDLSASWTVGNDNPGGRGWSTITAVADESARPWTTGSMMVDGRALTVECANSSGPPTYGIADESFEACARLAAYAYEAYGVPLRRITSASNDAGHIGHGEVSRIWPGQSYATSCPMNLDIDRILARAAQMVGGSLSGAALTSTPEQEEDDMYDEAARVEVVGRMDQQIIPLLQSIQQMSGWLLTQAAESQMFRVYRDMDDPSQQCYMLAPGIEWLVRNTDYLNLVIHYRLTGPPINVYGDGNGNVMRCFRDIYASMQATASNADIIARLDSLDLTNVDVPAADLSGIVLPSLADIAKTVNDEADKRERDRLDHPLIPTHP